MIPQISQFAPQAIYYFFISRFVVSFFIPFFGIPKRIRISGQEIVLEKSHFSAIPFLATAVLLIKKYALSLNRYTIIHEESAQILLAVIVLSLVIAFFKVSDLFALFLGKRRIDLEGKHLRKNSRNTFQKTPLKDYNFKRKHRPGAKNLEDLIGKK